MFQHQHPEVAISLMTLPRGYVEVPANNRHVLRVHAGRPSEGACARRRFRYTRGDIDLVPAGITGSWACDHPTTSLVLELAPSVIERAAREVGRAGSTGLPLRHQLRDARIEHIAWALEAESRSGFANGELYAGSLLLALAVGLISDFAVDLPRARVLSPGELARITDYIESNIDRSLSLDRLASVVDMSKSHLKALFVCSTGLTVHTFVMRRRVERAKKLLGETSLPAIQIALDAGFAHQSHMARWMRKILGKSPSAIERRQVSQRQG